MTRVAFKTKYESESQAGSGTLIVGAEELKLKASCSDSTFLNGVNLHGVSLGIEKPGAFLIDYDLHNQAARFQFMTEATVAGKLVKLTYIHPQKRNATLLEGTLALDSNNKVTAKYSFVSEHGYLKYTYVHGIGTTLEPAYDFDSQSWHFGIGCKFGKHDDAKAVYDGHNKNLGLEWTRQSKEYGHFKVTATVPVKDYKLAKMVAEKTWSVDI